MLKESLVDALEKHIQAHPDDAAFEDYFKPEPASESESKPGKPRARRTTKGPLEQESVSS